MPPIVSPPYLWMPQRGPDPAAIDRMARAFPRPATPMGEAWFMGDERRMYPQLRGALEALPDDDITSALEEIASGSSNFGPLREWIEWYHYLLPRLMMREWRPTYCQPAELLFTAFIAQHPASDGSLPYREFRNDALGTLGQYIMAPHFWPDGEVDVVKCLGKWTGPSGIAGWFDAGNLLSASLFFCTKYLAPSEVETWFRSVIAIADGHWQVQIMTWLVGAHPILIGEIQQPGDLPTAPFGVEWNWSHILDGNYSGNHQPPVHHIPFLPAENCAAIVEIARGMEVEGFLEDFLTDPKMNTVASEVAGMPERFLQLYRTDRLTD